MYRARTLSKLRYIALQAVFSHVQFSGFFLHI